MHAARAQVRVPKEVSDEEAAQFLVNPVTAYGCVEREGEEGRQEE